VTIAQKPKFHWLLLLLAIAMIASIVARETMDMPGSIFIFVFLASLLLAGVLFFLMNKLLSQRSMPSGWAQPVLDPKRARKELGLPEDGASKPTPPETTTDQYLTDDGAGNPEELAGEFLQMGRLLLKSGRYDEAKAAFDNAALQDPGNSKVYNYQGIAYGRLNEFDAAVDAYNKAIALDYDYASAHFNLASVFDQMNDSVNALEHWQRYLDVGQVVGERDDMLERARGRVRALKDGTDRIKRPQTPILSDSDEDPTD
jgi:tetratricopeptide (TPR) repeat protein